MKKLIKKVSLILIFIFSLTGISLSCDLLGFNIGGNKIGVENIFGPIEYEESDSEEMPQEKYAVVSTAIDNFCSNSNLGDTIFTATIVDDVIAGVAIEVNNGQDNAESKKKLLYNYVTATFGAIEDSDYPKWTGSKEWNVAGRIIFYYKQLTHQKYIIEGLLVSNEKYISYIGTNE
jgi:hypothetical protein